MQYAAAVHAEKLKKVLHRAANRGRPAGSTVGKQHFNPRLVPEEVICKFRLTLLRFELTEPCCSLDIVSPWGTNNAG